ncbi:hypothetical protein ACOSQ3_013311 [Xanthoceras sorbifolium]
MAYFSYSNRGFETKLLLGRIDGAIQVKNKGGLKEPSCHKRKMNVPTHVRVEIEVYQVLLTRLHFSLGLSTRARDEGGLCVFGTR